MHIFTTQTQPTCLEIKNTHANNLTNLYLYHYLFKRNNVVKIIKANKSKLF